MVISRVRSVPVAADIGDDVEPFVARVAAIVEEVRSQVVRTPARARSVEVLLADDLAVLHFEEVDLLQIHPRSPFQLPTERDADHPDPIGLTRLLAASQA